VNPTADRIQDEVQRAIQRSLKGLDYLASPAPAVGPTPKDVLLDRGTLHLYHYRALADEIYRIPILIVMATSNRGYILDLTAGVAAQTVESALAEMRTAGVNLVGTVHAA